MTAGVSWFSSGTASEHRAVDANEMARSTEFAPDGFAGGLACPNAQVIKRVAPTNLGTLRVRHFAVRQVSSRMFLQVREDAEQASEG